MIAPTPDESALEQPTAVVLPAKSAPQRRMSAGAWAICLLFAFLGGLCGVVLALYLMREPAPPPLTSEVLEAAAARWADHGPPSYNLDVEVTTENVSKYHLEVRDGQFTGMSIDGRPISRRASGEYWTVPGQFDILRTELENCANPAKALKVNDPNWVVLRAEFDPKYGYPLRCQRDMLGRGPTMKWKTLKFEAL
jgi:hypothetical protein